MGNLVVWRAVVTNAAGEASCAVRREVARAECFVGQAKRAVTPSFEAEALIPNEEERLVFTIIKMRNINWAAHGEAEVILRVHGFLVALKVVFPAVGIKRAVAEVVVSRGMESVSAGLHREANDAAAGFAKLGREIALQELNPLDRT